MNIKNDEQALATLATVRFLKRQVDAIRSANRPKSEKEELYYRVTKEAMEADIQMYRRRLLNWYDRRKKLPFD